LMILYGTSFLSMNYQRVIIFISFPGIRNRLLVSSSILTIKTYLLPAPFMIHKEVSTLKTGPFQISKN